MTNDEWSMERRRELNEVESLALRGDTVVAASIGFCFIDRTTCARSASAATSSHSSFSPDV